MSDVAAATAAPAPVTTEAPAQAPKTDAAPVATPADIRKLKLKYEGKDVDMAESDVVRYAQMGMSATKKWEEAAKMRKEATDFQKDFETNPTKAIKDIMKKRPEMRGLVKGQLEELLYDEYQTEQMTPEQKEAASLKAELEGYKSKEEMTKKEAEEKQFQSLIEKSKGEITKSITAGLEGTGLPKTPRTVKLMAEYMTTLADAGHDISTVDPVSIAQVVRQQYIQDFSEMITHMKGDELIDFFGKDNIKKVMRAEIDRRKPKDAPASLNTPEAAKPHKEDQPKQQKWLSSKDFDKLVGRR